MGGWELGQAGAGVWGDWDSKKTHSFLHVAGIRGQGYTEGWAQAGVGAARAWGTPGTGRTGAWLPVSASVQAGLGEGKWASAESLDTHPLCESEKPPAQPCPGAAWILLGSTLRFGQTGQRMDGFRQAGPIGPQDPSPFKAPPAAPWAPGNAWLQSEPLV